MMRLFLWLSLLIMPLSACGQSQPMAPQPGTDYEVLAEGQRWQPKSGKIEVVEVFAYWCSHCAHFQPMVDAWKKKMPAGVTFHYVPAAFDPEDVYARAYFAAEIAGAVPKTHSALFTAMHELGSVPMRNATAEELGTYFAERGLNRERMVGLMQSKDVDSRMQRAREFIKANQVRGTPTVIVNGKYLIKGRSLEERLRILDAVIAQERAAGKR